MRIEINGGASDAYYREICNVMFEAKRYKKKPNKKYVNTVKRTKLLMIVMAVAEVLYIAMGVAWGFDPIMYGLIGILGFLIVLYVFMYRSMMRYYRTLVAERGSSVFTLDEQGVELERIGAQTVRLAWDNIAFVRVFKNSMMFFSKAEPMVVIALDEAHMGPVIEYLKTHEFDVME